MSVIAPLKIDKVGLDILQSLTTAADADTVTYKSGTLIVAQNNDAASSTLTITADTASADCTNYGALPVTDLTFILATSAIIYFTLPSGYSVNNSVNLGISNATSFKVGVFTLGN